eukprot:m.342109 g.342109  ORF g.342109 m.342109 type:complete len:114 (-) comp16545_c0_seq67:2322-2663(-)
MSVLAVILGASQYQERQRRLRPMDMGAMQNELLTELGLGAATFSIGPDEIGLALAFEESEVHQVQSAHDTIRDSMSRLLLASLKEQKGLPKRLASMLRAPTTTVLVDPVECTT